MAEHITCHIVDDLDGSDITDAGGEHIEFSLRGVFYQLDLSAANVARLNEALRPFIDAADKVSGTPRTRRRNSRTKADRTNEPSTATPGSRAALNTTGDPASHLTSRSFGVET